MRSRKKDEARFEHIANEFAEAGYFYFCTLGSSCGVCKYLSTFHIYPAYKLSDGGINYTGCSIIAMMNDVENSCI